MDNKRKSIFSTKRAFVFAGILILVIAAGIVLLVKRFQPGSNTGESNIIPIVIDTNQPSTGTPDTFGIDIELSDGQSQPETVVPLPLATGEPLTLDEMAKEELGQLKRSATTSFQQVRDFIFELRPMILDDLGLIPTLKRYVDWLKEDSGLKINFTFAGSERRIEPYQEVMIFRAIQELLNNIIHHSEARGQRQSINEVARIARGKYLMKLDAHCAVAPGFDRVLIDDYQPGWTVVPRMYNLDVETWQPKLHKKTDYMYIGWNDRAELRTLYYEGDAWKHVLTRQVRNRRTLANGTLEGDHAATAPAADAPDHDGDL